MARCSNLFCVAVAALAACGDNIRLQPDSLPIVCTAGTAFAAGSSWFLETTAQANLTGIGGQRLAVIDFDGDGYPDLVVRRDATGIEDFSSPAGRHTFLLHNRRNGTFEDVTEASGLLARRAGSGGRPVAVVAFADVDNDGDLDAYTGTVTSNPAASGGEHSEIMINDGAGHFTLGPVSDVCAASRVDTVAGASFVDFDRDGFIDLWVPQHDDGSVSVTGAQAHLFRGDGTGAFTDVTASAGLTTNPWTSTSDINAGLAHPRATGALACDLDGDGTTELLAPADARTPNHLYQGVRIGTAVMFENRGVASGYAYDSNIDWTDNLFVQCYCRDVDPGAQDCTGVPAPTYPCVAGWNPTTDHELYRLGGNTESTTCGDLDNDGDMDVMTSELRHWYIGGSSDRSEVLVNTGDPQVRFARPGAAAMGLAIDYATVDWNEGLMTAAFWDFDNDGWLDIYEGATDYPGNRGHLYRQKAPLSLEEVATGDFFSHFRSQGLAIADFDRDGDLDIVVGHSLLRCDSDCQLTDNIRMFVNSQGSAGNWIELSLSARTGTINGAAIGARVRVTAGGITQTREIGGGYGHGAQDDVTLHIGLGTACEPTVEIRWPDAALTTETHTLQAGYRFAVAPRTAPVAIR